MNFFIAIPNTSLVDEIHQLNKTKKISQIARACATFRVDTIFIYDEDYNFKSDRKLLIEVLRYMDTPQFLRKKIFSKTNELKYSGITSPLKIPSHNTVNKITKIKSGDIKDGIIVSINKKMFVYIGFDFHLPYFGKKMVGNRIQIKFQNGYPNLNFKEIKREEINDYWGYKIKTKRNLLNFLLSWNGDIILTSRKGIVTSVNNLRHYTGKKNMLVVFGTPNRGLHDILGNKINIIPHSKILNFFPNQKTMTIRLEEAINGVLSILNLFQHN